MKAKFVLPALLAMMLVGCNKSEGGKNPPSPPEPPTPEQYSETIYFNAFGAFNPDTEPRKSSEEAPRARLTADIEGKMVKTGGGSLITSVSYGDTSSKNTQILKVGYQIDSDDLTVQANEPDYRFALVLGTGSKGGELHFTFVDTLVKVKIYANAYHSWGWNTSMSPNQYAKTRDKGSTLTVNEQTLAVTQCGTDQTEEAFESAEFEIGGKQLDISNEVSTSTQKKRVIIQKMEFTFEKE